MTPKGLVVILIIVALTGGIGAAWDFIKTLAVSMWEFVKVIPGLFAVFAPLAGVNDWLTSKAIYFAILAILSWGGFVLSQKKQNTLWAIISGIVGNISTMATLAGVS